MTNAKVQITNKIEISNVKILDILSFIIDLAFGENSITKKTY
jgi:hypothetical protein